MTSRRSINQWDARLSRAMQFVPGHVSGRVNSAQPVVRRKGIGMAGAAATAPPIHAWEFAGYESYEGGLADFDIPDTGSLGPGYGNDQSLVVNYYDVDTFYTDSLTMGSGDRTPTVDEASLALPDVWTFYLEIDWLSPSSLSRAAVLVYDVTDYTRGMAIQTHPDYLRFHYQWDNFYGIPNPFTNYFLSTDMPTERTRIRWVTDRINGTAVVEVDGTTVYDGSPSQFWGAGYTGDYGMNLDARGDTRYWSVRFYDGDVPLSRIAGAT